MVSESYVAIAKQLHTASIVYALRCFSSRCRNHGLTADAYDSLSEVAPKSAEFYRVEAQKHQATSTAALVAELRPAGPLDVRCMPRILQAFHRHARVSMAYTTARNYVSLVKKLFKGSYCHRGRG